MLFKKIHRAFRAAESFDVLDLGKPFKQRRKVTQLGEYGAGGFLAYSRHARIVVGRVALERVDLSYIFGPKPIVLFSNSSGILSPHIAESGVHEQ